MNTTTREPEPGFSYDASRKRLQAIATDAAALDSFERIAQSGEMEQEFVDAVVRLNIRLDYVLRDKSEPFVPAEVAA
jgi:hypothetical protein